MAERPRENLIMDSGVCITIEGETYRVRFVTRAERAVFPGEGDDSMFARARKAGESASSQRAYAEVGTSVRSILDPGDESRVLDTWFEVAFEKRVSGEDPLLDEVAFVMQLEKAASR